MKNVATLGLLLSVIMTYACLNSCSDDGGIEENYEFIYGTWYGIRSYDNPASGIKYQYLTITFDSDKTGTMDYETSSGYTAYVFTYSISDNMITCKGAKANTYGDVDENYVIKIKIEGDRLIPQNSYTSFILTRDGSVETDSDGNEIIDKSDILIGNWIREGGEAVLCIKSSEDYSEYLLTSSNSDKYYYYGEGKYSYDKRYKQITFGSTTYEILHLDSKKLSVKNVNTQSVWEHRIASKNDIPTILDLETLLSYYSDWTSDKDGYFIFSKDGKVRYIKGSSVNVGSYGYTSLVASGLYRVSGSTLVCSFGTVHWEGGEMNKYKDIFPGWTYNRSCVKKYSIEYKGNNKIIITDSSNKEMEFKGSK